MKFLPSILCAAWILLPAQALACACGCGVFDVGGDTLVANEKGLQTFFEYDELDQTQNWHGTSKAPAADNTDKRITTNFVVLGAQDMVSDKWGVMVEVPVTDRTFRTTDPGRPTTFHDTAFGDLRVMGVYTGLSSDMSTGIIAGLRLPTGDWRARGFDRDVEIGSGSTDALLGAYHYGPIGKGAFSYLVQALGDVPFATQGGYRPGAELDASASVSYTGWSVGGGKLVIEPLLQLIGSFRAPDHGPAADPDNTGYSRLLISPALQLSHGPWSLYGDVELPIYQNVKGDQLIAPEAFKLVLRRKF
ncbi:MAG TPA: hypothetical protein VKT30_07395 [Caulobacteraceae bacterium]|nr:hypothetical protein [Caulobacteraceae bacterium]